MAIADEQTANRFTSPEHTYELTDKFDMTMMSRQIEVADYDTLESKGLDLENLIKNAMRNHVGRRRRRDEMNEEYGPGTS